MKSFVSLLNEALPPPSPPMGGAADPMGAGGGMPPPSSSPPPMPPMGGGMPPMGGPPGMGMGGDGQASKEPVPVRTIDVIDVWDLLKKCSEDMDKHEELNVNYKKNKKTSSHKM